MLRGTREVIEGVFRLNERCERELIKERWSASLFQNHAVVQKLFVQEDRFYSKPEKKLLSPKRCKVEDEEKGK